MGDQIRINGAAHSWPSVAMKIDNQPYNGFTSIKFADKRERVKGYGMGRHHAPTRRSKGKYTVEAVQLSGYTGTIQILREQIAARSADGISYGDVEFNITLSYFEPGDKKITVLLERCTWGGNSASHEENADPLKEDIELDCMLIRRNGLVLFDGSQGQP